jgi:hypothetical protein
MIGVEAIRSLRHALHTLDGLFGRLERSFDAQRHFVAIALGSPDLRRTLQPPGEGI